MPTFSRKFSRSTISRRMSRAMWRSVSVSCTSSSHPSAPRTDSAVKWWIGMPATSTARDSGRSRAPPHAGHGRTLMYSSIFSRENSLSVSL